MCIDNIMCSSKMKVFECVCVCVFAGPGEVSPDVGGSRGGGGAERTDQRALGEKRSAGERKLHPPSPQGQRLSQTHDTSTSASWEM